MPDFAFETNPFYILRASPRDGQDALAEAAENAVSGGRATEKDALGAQRALMAAKPRLDAELAWFPGVAPSTVSRILESLARPSAVAETGAELPELVRANVAAQRAAGGDASAIQDLIEAQATIDPDATMSAVNADRSVAGFPRVDRTLLDQALLGLKSAHVRAAVQALMSSVDPPQAIADLSKKFVPAIDARRDFIEEVVERYDVAAAARVAAVEQTVNAAIRSYADTGDRSALEEVQAAMKAWRGETEARRVVFSTKKLDEPRSAELFRTVRELGKELVNKRDAPERAQELFGALRAAFVDVPSVADQMDRDISEIADIVMQKRFEAVAGDLVAALAEARADLDTAIFCLREDGFREGARGIAGRLYAGFEKAARGLAGTEHASLPWTGVRQLAIEITNKATTPIASRILVEALAKYDQVLTPPDVANLLAKDRRSLDSIDLTEKLTAAMKAGRTGQALRVISSLEAITDDETELATLRDVRTKIEAKKRSKRNQAIGWTVAVAVIGGIAALNDQGTTTTSQSYTPQAAPQTPYTPSYPSPAAPPDSPTAVVMPPVSKQRTLSRQELRWCMFQLQRLKDVQALLPNPAVPYEADAFNVDVADWRSRCVQNFYDKSDKAIVDENVASRSGQFASEADEIVRSWRQTESQTAQAAAPSAASRLLDLRSRDDVAEIQKRLAADGLYKGFPDGAWGPASRAALVRFKRANGLAPNDVWDAETQRKLFGSAP